MNAAAMYVFYFFFYSCLGWIVESIYCSVPVRKWVNRGFLTGPLCPIYGTGAVVLSVCLKPLMEHSIPVSVFGISFSITPVLVFFAGMILADIVEFITSVIMEKLFHARWWDYSEKPFNIQGRICLQHTFFWGIGTIVFLYFVHPFFSNYLERIPMKAIYIILITILCVFAVDLANAVRTAMDVRKVMDKVHKLSDTISKFANDIKENVEVRVDELQATAAKRTERFTVWRGDLSKQIAEIIGQVEISISKKRVDSEKRNRLFMDYPNLGKVAKKQLLSLEELLAEIKKRLTDDDSEING